MTDATHLYRDILAAPDMEAALDALAYDVARTSHNARGCRPAAARVVALWQAHKWNVAHAIGTAVDYYPLWGIRHCVATTTRSVAFISHDESVVQVEGYCGYVSLHHVVPAGALPPFK